MKYAIIDLETTIKKSFKRTANPFDPVNYIVKWGIKDQELGMQISSNNSGQHSFMVDRVYVGHNIKFDLLYIYMLNKRNHGPDSRPTQIWDTQLAEYILSGYETKMPALRTIAVQKYGCAYREKSMELFWDNDICTSRIPQEIVENDLKWDLLDTEQVFLQQIKKAKDMGLTKFIKTQMNALLATTEIEFNGLHIDNEMLERVSAEKKIELDTIQSALLADANTNYWELPVEFNLNSRDHVSILLFGGSLKVKEKEAVGLFKNGNVKYKLIDHIYHQAGIIEDVELKETAKAGVYKVDESTLSNIDHPYVTQLLHYRKLAKDYGTYYEGLGVLVNPVDNCIHHQLLHVTTTTGRLSSRDPNMQNIPRSGTSEIKKVFTSRFPGGSIVEFDYAQLEVRVAACVYNDATLLHELNSNIDLYMANAVWFYKKPETEVTKDERQVVKGFILGILYGKGSYSLARESGLEQEDCQEFIDKFYQKYTNIAHHHRMMIDYANNNKIASSYLTTKGNKANMCKYKTVIGNVLTFVETDAPDFITRKTGLLTNFNPPDLKNHPIQSVAGNLVLIMVAEVNAWIQRNNKQDEIKLINTIHDSVMLDVKQFSLDLDSITSLLEDLQRIVKEKFGLDWKCAFPVEMKIGDNWYDCK